MTTRDTDKTEALRTEIVRGIVDQLGVPEAVAMPFANSVLAHLQRQYAGERIYIPRPSRQYDVLQIEAQLRSGESPNSVAAAHQTTVRQLQRLFPGGLPRPQDVA